MCSYSPFCWVTFVLSSQSVPSCFPPYNFLICFLHNLLIISSFIISSLVTLLWSICSMVLFVIRESPSFSLILSVSYFLSSHSKSSIPFKFSHFLTYFAICDTDTHSSSFVDVLLIFSFKYCFDFLGS